VKPPDHDRLHPEIEKVFAQDLRMDTALVPQLTVVLSRVSQAGLAEPA
jgi:hypothetical protein